MSPALKSWVRALALTAPIEREPTRTLSVLIDELADRHTLKPALVAREATLTYRDLAAASNRYARWAAAQHFERGDSICLLMCNCVDYLPVWIGLSRAGLTVALLNTALRGDALAHCIRAAAPRAVIVGGSLGEVIADVRPGIDRAVGWWTHGGDGAGLPRLDLEACALDGAAVSDAEIARPTLTDRALLIYTSGTTGLPKAANVSHMRVMQWSHWFAGMMDTTPEDRMYDCLPLYHSVGGVVSTGATLVGGGTVVLREHFSAREFWRDIATERCTLFQYIGELCRYLVQGEPDACESAHALRLCCGNGLRAEVWECFRQRFRIPRILEYYASTEGSFSLYNCEGRPGAIGRIPSFLKHRTPVEIVRFDPETELPARDANGRCILCPADEPGEALGRLQSSTTDAPGRFEGYSDVTASSDKILRDVLSPGDAWYRTGDLMRRDEQGFFYFVDRVGDTYRWKGENVSASEVLAVVASCPAVAEAVVYGIRIPGIEGRAGMATLVVQTGFSLAGLRDHLARAAAAVRPTAVRFVSPRHWSSPVPSSCSSGRCRPRASSPRRRMRSMSKTGCCRVT